MKKNLKKGKKARTKKANHHDILFKEAYSDPRRAKELFRLFLSEEDFLAFNWDDLKPEKDTFKHLRADLVFSVTLKAEPKDRIIVCLLVEHKSQFSPKSYCQMLKYKTSSIIRSFEETGEARPVFAFLFHHGKKPWPGEKSLKKGLWGRILSKIPLSLQKYMLDCQLIVLDANEPRVKRAIKNIKIKSRGFLNLLKKSSVLRPDAEELKKYLSLFDNWPGDRENLSVELRNYLWSATPGMTEKLWRELDQYCVKKGIFSKGGYMNAREQIERKGHRKGRIAERKEVILKMLKEKADISFISKVTGVTVKEIKKLKNGS